MGNELFDKLWEEFSANRLFDEIYVSEGKDKYDNHFLIFEDWDEVRKFNDFVCETFTQELQELEYERPVDDKYDTSLERFLGVEFVFSDEYDTCCDCGRIVRTSPTSYGWTPDFRYFDGGLVCKDCIMGNEDLQESYLEELVNNPSSANQLFDDYKLEELGFEKINTHSYENGFFQGQTDDPKVIFSHFQNQYEQIVFSIDRVGQFDIHYSAWGRNPEEDLEE